MKKIISILGIVSLLISSLAQAKNNYQVRNLNQFAQLMENINAQHATRLKQFIAQLDPSATHLNPQQTIQYCALMQQSIDENFAAYDINRQLFTGPGAMLSKADFVNKVNAEPLVQTLKRQGVSCNYQ
ncbi:hypothetical protein F4V57_04225 [Acinetobacter qingfengensis]|uniref:Uncharacterized protein n=1 Tax=Acinetobacter qingfengensis TaxID=1262585 RepID=A0A1E7RCI3_9GAMM|nr:hypothetical protein [Acinetobacter qingfengensis]KAA8734971.1 hypothetical protein F4V57_04225 [Acinetobacter qingfengensis]OEY97058.1 hypothetical protein BJI46_11030 [Acinetobacter qingfengensis]